MFITEVTGSSAVVQLLFMFGPLAPEHAAVQ